MKVTTLHLLSIITIAEAAIRLNRRNTKSTTSSNFRKTSKVDKNTIVQLLPEDDEFHLRTLQENSMIIPVPTPTPRPTSRPVDAPTPKPGPDQCGLELGIFCQTNTDPAIPCDEIPAPEDPQCATGEKLDAVELSWENRKCDKSNNGQGDNFSCEDFKEVKMGDVAELTCYNRDDPSEIVCQCTTISKATITGPQQILPDYVTCEIANENLEVAQIVTFATGGDIDLRLGDTYGMLTVDGCSDENDTFINKQCCYEVNYIYVLENTGSESFTVSEYERDWPDRDDEKKGKKDLLKSIPEGDRTVAPGGYLPTLQEPGLIDVCKDKCYKTVLEAETRDIKCKGKTESVDCFKGIPPRPNSIPDVGEIMLLPTPWDLVLLSRDGVKSVSSESSLTFSEKGVTLSQATNGALKVLNDTDNTIIWESFAGAIDPYSKYATYLQSDGDLVTREEETEDREVAWRPQLEIPGQVRDGNYYLVLTNDYSEVAIYEEVNGLFIKLWGSA